MVEPDQARLRAPLPSGLLARLAGSATVPGLDDDGIDLLKVSL